MRKRRIISSILTSVMFYLVASYLVTTIFSPDVSKPLNVWLLILCVAGFAVIPTMLFVIGPLQAGNRVQKSERLRPEATWHLGGDAIQIITQYAESKIDWGTFQKAIMTKHHYLLVYTVNKQAFQIIPRRAFESAEQEAAFREIVERHLGKIKGSPVAQKPTTG